MGRRKDNAEGNNLVEVGRKEKNPLTTWIVGAITSSRRKEVNNFIMVEVVQSVSKM
jgi:hypothetical protein